MPTFQKIGPGFSLSTGSRPNNCACGFSSTRLHVTQLCVMECKTLRFPMMWKRPDNDAVISVGPACTCRSLRCLLQISKTTKGCLPGRITGWRLAYVSTTGSTYHPHVIYRLHLQTVGAVEVCSLEVILYPFAMHSVHLNIRSSALLRTNFPRLRSIPYILLYFYTQSK